MSLVTDSTDRHALPPRCFEWGGGAEWEQGGGAVGRLRPARHGQETRRQETRARTYSARPARHTSGWPSPSRAKMNGQKSIAKLPSHTIDITINYQTHGEAFKHGQSLVTSAFWLERWGALVVVGALRDARHHDGRSEEPASGRAWCCP